MNCVRCNRKSKFISIYNWQENNLNTKNLKATLVLLLMLFVTGCGVSQPVSTSVPTSVPTNTPQPSPVDPVNEISFADLEPAGFKEGWSWNAIGVDKAGHAYLAIGYGDVGKPNDVGVFQYTIATGERKFLTTLKTVSQADNNLLPGENIIKGHTRIVEMDGKIYLGSQGFHDIFEIDPSVRGGHFFQMDVATEQWHDLSATDPAGVSIPNQGIIAVDVIPGENKVVGLTSPAGDIVIYDLVARKSTVYTGTHEYLGRNVSRHVVYAHGKIYAAFAGSPMLKLDLATSGYSFLPKSQGEFEYGPGPGFDDGNEFATAMAETHDGNHIYYLSWNGILYHFDVATERLTRVGPVNTADELAKGVKVGTAFALAISNDDKYLYTIPSSMSDKSTGLYRYDIASGVWVKLADYTVRLGNATFTGGETDDAGRIYFARFGDESKGWVHLLQIDVNNLQP